MKYSTAVRGGPSNGYTGNMCGKRGETWTVAS